MKKIILFFILLSILFTNLTDNVSASSYVAEQSARLKVNKNGSDPDYRIYKLKNFFKAHNSPLVDYSQNMIQSADKYGLDWRFVPAITGVESTFGKNIPLNSYNAYGWANGAYYFNSWEESIEVVSKTLKEKYIDRGAVSINQIARRYAPPSKTWAWKVQYFMNKIDPMLLTFTL